MKKLIALLLALTLILALPACGSEGKTEDKATQKENTSTEGQKETESGKAEKVEEAVGDQVYLLAQVINYGIRYDFAYDEHGNMVKCPVVGGGKTELEYDENHRIVKRTWNTDEGELRKHEEYTYNEEGQLVHTDCYSKDGSLSGTWEFAYNGEGLLTEKKYMDADGTAIKCVTYAYENGLLVEEQETHYDDVSYRDTYAYDAQGNCVEYIRYTGSGKVSTHQVYTYNAEGKLQTEGYPESGIVVTLTYDSEGRLVEETSVGEKTKVYQYTYDENGNLIKKDRMTDGVAEDPVEYMYLPMDASKVDAQQVYENMIALLEEQGLAPLQR